MGRLRRVRKGDKIEAADFNAMVDAIEARTPLSFHNGLLTRLPHGFHVRDKSSPKFGTATASTHPFKLSAIREEDTLKATFDYGAAVDFSDWSNPKIYEARVGAVALSTRPAPKLTLPSADTIYVYLKIIQASDGSIDASEESLVLVAFDAEQSAVSSNIAYIPVATVTTTLEEGDRRVTGIKQALASHVIWPLKPGFMGWVQPDAEDEDSKSAFWLGDQSPYRPGASTLNDLWIQVRRDDFDNGIDAGDSVFFLGMDEEGESYQLALHRSAKRGLWSILNDTDSTWALDAKAESDPGAKITSSDDEASLVIQGKNETANIQASAGDDTATITLTGEEGSITLLAESTSSIEVLGQDGGSAKLIGSENGQLSLDDGDVTLDREGGLQLTSGSETGIYEASQITLDGDVFSPQAVNSNGSPTGTKTLATGSIDLFPLPPCIEWDDGTSTLDVGTGSATAISTIGISASGSGGAINLTNASNPSLTVEIEGGKAMLSADEDNGILNLNNGAVLLTPEGGLVLTDGSNVTTLANGSLTMTDGSNTVQITPTGIAVFDSGGDGVYIDIAGWIQQKKDGNQVYMDPADVPTGSSLAGFKATSGYASISEGEEC